MYDDVIECLDALAHLHLGIISNGERETQIAKLEKFALTKRFATVVLAGEVGLAKPDPAIFQHACQKAGYAPEQCLFVGDNFAADVLGGSNARLLPVYLKRNPDHKQEGEHLHSTISTLRNLPSIVQSA